MSMIAGLASSTKWILVSAIRNNSTVRGRGLGSSESRVRDHRPRRGPCLRGRPPHSSRGRRRARPAARSPRSTSVESRARSARRRRDLRRHRRGPRRRDHRGAGRGDPDGFNVRKVSDRTFLMHLGGKIEVDAARCRCKNRDDLSRAYTPGRRPGLPGDRREPRRRPAAHDQAQHRRRGHRRVGRARPRQHRPGRRAAGDGGQGGAVQAVRRRRRLAGLPGHPGHRRDRP